MIEHPSFIDTRPTHFGIVHKPLMVTTVASNRREGQVVAFIGKQLCFFENDGYIPQVGETLEVMISRPLYPRYPAKSVIPSLIGEKDVDISGSNDRSRLTAVLIRPVEPDKHRLMAITGFECVGTMCRTTTRAIVTDGTRSIPISKTYGEYDSPISLTPGRCGIRVSDNIGSSDTWTKTIPTNVYVEKQLMEERGTMFYISGITRVEDCQYANLFKK